MSNKSGIERRRSKRTDLLETFSLFVSVPSKGPHRLKVHDLSDLGIGFDFDIEEEAGANNLPVESGAKLEIHLYLNQSLYIALQVTVRRVQTKGSIRNIGAEFSDRRDSPSRLAVLAFLDMLEAVSGAATVQN